MERLAREAYMVGTEWDQYDTVFALDWQFDTLEAAFEEGGVLHGQKVWVFGATEPQLVEWKGMHRVVQIPAVVAVSRRALASMRQGPDNPCLIPLGVSLIVWTHTTGGTVEIGGPIAFIGPPTFGECV